MDLGAVSMVRLGNAAQALEMLERAHAVAKGLGDHQTEFRIWVNMSVVHEALEEFEKAIAAVQTSLMLALELRLSQTRELMGDLGQALSHHRQYHDVQTGVLRVHAAARAQVLSARLDNERVRMETALFRLRAADLERDNHT